MNIGSLIEDNIKKFGKYDMTCFEGRWYTNVELNQNANRFGNALKSLGIKKGDRVAVQMLNSPEVISAFPAIQKIGGSIVPLVPILRPEQASLVYRDSGAKAVLTSPEFLGAVLGAQHNSPDLKHIILTGGDNVVGTISYEKLMSNSSDKLVMEDTDNDDLAALVYTAGTTGRPKGVMHTHNSIYSNCIGFVEYGLIYESATLRQSKRSRHPITREMVESTHEVFGINRNMVRLSVLPLSHLYGVAIMNLDYYLGSKSVVFKIWNTEQALKAIEEFRVTHMEGVPTMYIQMLNFSDLGKYDLSSLERCGCGGAPVPVELAQKWKERVGTYIWQGWGMTELGALTTTQPADRPPRYDSIGICVPKSVTMKIFDENDRELPSGKQGEIVVKGPTVMKGYWNMPEETAKTTKNGWFYSGDIGYRDEDGYFYITDRKKDIIIRGGENVSPKEVEEVICKHPKVAEVSVIGIPDKTYGEEVKAFVTLKTGEQVTEEEIIAFCKYRLPTFKTPKKVQFLSELPKSPIGKVLKTELRKLS